MVKPSEWAVVCAILMVAANVAAIEGDIVPEINLVERGSSAHVHKSHDNHEGTDSVMFQKPSGGVKATPKAIPHQKSKAKSSASKTPVAGKINAQNNVADHLQALHVGFQEEMDLVLAIQHEKKAPQGTAIGTLKALAALHSPLTDEDQVDEEELLEMLTASSAEEQSSRASPPQSEVPHLDHVAAAYRKLHSDKARKEANKYLEDHRIGKEYQRATKQVSARKFWDMSPSKMKQLQHQVHQVNQAAKKAEHADPVQARVIASASKHSVVGQLRAAAEQAEQKAKHATKTAKLLRKATNKATGVATAKGLDDIGHKLDQLVKAAGQVEDKQGQHVKLEKKLAVDSVIRAVRVSRKLKRTKKAEAARAKRHTKKKPARPKSRRHTKVKARPVRPPTESEREFEVDAALHS